MGESDAGRRSPSAIPVTRVDVRVARPEDLPALERLASAAIDRLLRPFLTESQVLASSAIMGVDARLIEDGTYALAECDGIVVGCGGWSRRRTMYGGDGAAGRDDGGLDPAVDAARVRAMYTHPDAVRRGIGRCILGWCEVAAAAEGFTRLELVATLAGAPLYTTAGFSVDGHFDDTSTGVAIPLLRMSKRIGGPHRTDQPKETA